MYKYLIAISVVLASLVGAFAYGHHVASVAAERDALALRVEHAEELEASRDIILERDAQLYIEQNREAEIKYVTKIKRVVEYRDKLVDSGQCINDSGLLELINATSPTAE